jgi:hypothetical protein
VFALLFILQGTKKLNVLVLGLFLMLIVSVFIINKEKIKLPKYYLLTLAVYLFYLSIGLLNWHNNMLLDIKFQFFAFAFFFCIINVNVSFIKLLFLINTFIFIIYILLYFYLIPNIWSDYTFGYGGRIYGPPIIAINFLLFYYLLNNRPFDRKLVFASLMGLTYIALTTNFMNLAVFFILIFLLAVNFKKLLKPVYIISFLGVILIGVLYLNSPFVPELVSAKMQYVYQPWNYSSLRIRLDDLIQILDKENFGIFKQIFGEGFGTSSEIYRFNEKAVSLSDTFSFQEIDNGFYYLYHRGGWTLLSIFILAHFYLALKIRENKARLGFIALVFITCILSIHYFNYWFYMLIPYFIIYKQRRTNYIKI